MTARPLDDVLRTLPTSLRDRFVVRFNQENIFDVLQLELHSDHYFNVGFNRLVRNEALPGDGAC